MEGVDIRYCTGNGKEIKSIEVAKYAITWTDTDLAIGCQQHSKEEWLDFTDNEIRAMDEGALEWWVEWCPKLKALGAFD